MPATSRTLNLVSLIGVVALGLAFGTGCETGSVQSNTSEIRCNVSGEAGPCVTECGSRGRLMCRELGTLAACTPPPEICGNGEDDDCDGIADEHCSSCGDMIEGCVSRCSVVVSSGDDVGGYGNACRTGCGSMGASTCEAGSWSTCRAPTESCGNNIDDDCDGMADEDCGGPCTPGGSGACTTSCGSGGERTCNANRSWDDVCVAPSEKCGNAIDDDCDGAMDEDCGPVCTPGQTTGCATTCGSTGTRACSAAGAWGACAVPSEKCGNEVDDDCDGSMDEGCQVRCEDTEGHNCNGDMGRGDRCAAQDNTGGCTAERFHAWCNRRNPAYPGIWDAYLSGWVDARCDGTVQLEPDQQYADYYCSDSQGIKYACKTPLVLSFDNAPVDFESSAHRFALEPTNPAGGTDWPSAATPWLAYDRDGSGSIEDGRELFGSATLLADGGRARHGFAALAELDSNHDGVIDAADPAYPNLLAWRDRNRDGVSQAGELSRLAAEGIERLETQYQVAEQCDARGNCARERAPMAFRGPSGQTRVGAVIDVYLAVRGSASSPGPAPLSSLDADLSCQP